MVPDHNLAEWRLASAHRQDWKIINPVQNKNDTRPISMQLINWENFQLNCHIQLNI